MAFLHYSRPIPDIERTLLNIEVKRRNFVWSTSNTGIFALDPKKRDTDVQHLVEVIGNALNTQLTNPRILGVNADHPYYVGDSPLVLICLIVGGQPGNHKTTWSDGARTFEFVEGAVFRCENGKIQAEVGSSSSFLCLTPSA
ncbi:uncharacterized protein Z520_04637 [Fonsecaea multimorphosa CBS 102226]|uniref:Uncharacterized protein n=1 Tax=Fonsecaea multimorphosa CBS 102226 TaxID=1442371 RepID=A0A0D2KA29_9EURO|nr:uncharacterized protein Z520_04637 [Fonsecaea multimorphosa CBS 102226]KIX99999.1 hypothetical protein Z520_04637 [Fonsecaea multimorphosa CBS 102226]